MANWILIFVFSVPNNLNFNNPLIMDSFATREQCESTLFYITKSYEEVGIRGNGHCWGETK